MIGAGNGEGEVLKDQKGGIAERASVFCYKGERVHGGRGLDLVNVLATGRSVVM